MASNSDLPLTEDDGGPRAPDPPSSRGSLQSAEGLKLEGNEHFRGKRWDEALAAYRSALGYLPRRPEAIPPEASDSRGVDDDDLPGPSDGAVPLGDQPNCPTSAPPAEIEVESAKARAVLNANIAACFVKLDDPKEVVVACTEALKDDPNYVKALQRRATANEQIDTWSSLSSAQEDYKQLLELLPSSSSDAVAIRRTMISLTPRVEAAQKRETAEMLGKLKGIGNSILGNFGLSTDNFQFVPNGQGGYSMNFVQQP
ncbi:TPR-like protein [Epithele typhae]|uniref:TPR-like protein n=1 Tax=Epithele typhae TaxID=378194 RepID=UPI00200898CC|nr:TPR-like protein [Epithele typhae]KAH9944090.1 TPR-like protein [Epithele typhae]